jgi:hypothetical protein
MPPVASNVPALIPKNDGSLFFNLPLPSKSLIACLICFLPNLTSLPPLASDLAIF